jgi:putative endonuclease
VNEVHEDITPAIQRESNMKHWPRAWKVRLILATIQGGGTYIST